MHAAALPLLSLRPAGCTRASCSTAPAARRTARSGGSASSRRSASSPSASTCATTASASPTAPTRTRTGARSRWRGGGRRRWRAPRLSHHTAAAAAAPYPFLYDSVYDCSRVLDYLETRADADCSRVGAFGNSLGGMIIPLLAAADARLTACAPCIGVQGFAYALDHECWHARVGSLQPLFDAVADDRGAPLDGAAVRAAWRSSSPASSTRTTRRESLAAACLDADVLVVNSAADPRCPRPGVEAAVDARAPRSAAGAPTAAPRPPLGRERGGGAAPGRRVEGRPRDHGRDVRAGRALPQRSAHRAGARS